MSARARRFESSEDNILTNCGIAALADGPMSPIASTAKFAVRGDDLSFRASRKIGSAFVPVDNNAFAARIFALAGKGRSRAETFNAVWKETMREELNLVDRAAIPYLDEPWYC